MKTFYTWILAQEYRKDPVGDLARDMKYDDELPKHKTKNTLLNHMLRCGCISEAEDTLHVAWREYKLFRKSKKDNATS